MNPLLALAQRLDDWANRKHDPVIVATLATSPDRAQQPIVPSPRNGVVWSCCPCCRRFFTPAPCPIIHRTPCDKAACGQWSLPVVTS